MRNKLVTLFDFYMYFKDAPLEAQNTCPFNKHLGNSEWQESCHKLCFFYTELDCKALFNESGEETLAARSRCPCMYYGGYEAFKRLKKLLIRKGYLPKEG